jgi:hypothetical protein
VTIDAPPRPPVRWRLWLGPALAMLAAGGAGLVWAWSTEAAQRQERIVRTMLVIGPLAIAELGWLLLWILALSRLRPRARCLACGAVLALLALVAALVRFEGFSGDVRPRFTWRWARAPGALPTPAVRAGSAATVPAATFGDYSQFLGPRRDGTVQGVRLAADWTGAAPRRMWRRDIGAGWSGFAVAAGRAVTMEQRGGDELVTCYDGLSGEPLWAHATPVAGPARARRRRSSATACSRSGPRDCCVRSTSRAVPCCGRRTWSAIRAGRSRATASAPRRKPTTTPG